MVGLNRRIGVSLARGAAAPAAPTLGPELWPQPAFDASTGLTLVRCSVTGGQLVGNGAEFAATATTTLAGGSINQGDQFQYSYNNVGNGGGRQRILVSGNAGSPITATAGVHTGTITISSVPLDQTLVMSLIDNFAGDKVDDVSIKKLS